LDEVFAALVVMKIPTFVAICCPGQHGMVLAILCGTNHQYTASPYNKLWQASNLAVTNGNATGAVSRS